MFCPPICLRPLGQVTALDIHKIVDKRSRQAAPKTVLNEVRLLKNIFQLAVDLGLVERNPVGREHQPHLEAKTVTTWTLAQLQDILGETPAEHRALLATAAVSELRFCECLNLSGDDLDFAQQTLRVRKSRAGRTATRRLLPVGPLLLEVLADHLKRTPPRPPANLLFSDPAGGKLNPHRLKKVLYLVLSNLRFPRRGVGLASFRATRQALLTAPWGDPPLQAAVAEQRRLLAAANLASAWAQKRAVALALEQAILAGASAAVPPQEQAQAAAAEAKNVAKEGGKPIPRMKLDIPPESGGEQEAPETENPLPKKIERMKLEAFLGGGL